MVYWLFLQWVMVTDKNRKVLVLVQIFCPSNLNEYGFFRDLEIENFDLKFEI
jgi:hypothetical protein